MKENPAQSCIHKFRSDVVMQCSNYLHVGARDITSAGCDYVGPFSHTYLTFVIYHHPSLLLSIRPFIYYVPLTEEVEPIPADFKRETGYTMSRSIIYRIANTKPIIHTDLE